MVHRICVCVFVHIGHAKVIVSARTPLSYDVWLRHRRGPMITIYGIAGKASLSVCDYVMGCERAM